ncbi:MAG: hypothetical protein QGI33_06755, partial [Candidatus Brocadiia bacterium]|nr:hypothetical protein [Candidatus Brocadiia bacterium]
MALSSLGDVRGRPRPGRGADNAPEIGLIGASAEMAQSACLVQAYGPSAMLRRGGHYKAFRDVTSDFRRLVGQADGDSAFLYDGVPSREEHREDLLEAAQFGALAEMRAGGLHAGSGVEAESAIFVGRQVAGLLGTLRASRRIGPYLPHVPRCPAIEQERTVLVDDLARRLDDGEPWATARTLASLYLVLPDPPEDDPEWLRAVAKLAATPKARDIHYLLDIVRRGVPVSLR